MVRTIILVVGVISCLGTLGVETASFAAVLAASGFAVGMALQGTLSHFASGVMILLFKPFTVGQYIKVAGAEGTVANIDLFTTELDTPDKRRVIVPNGSIFGSQIENVSHHDTRRVDVAVGTDYGADLDKTREILMNAANSLPQVMKDPAAVVVLTSLGASSVDWSVRVWVNASDYWPVMDALTRVVKYELDKADIGIPFPQMDVNFENAMFSGGASSSNTTSANTVQ